MDEQTKQTINNIIKLVKERKTLLEELGSLDDYKNKIEKVKKQYARKTKLSKSGGASASRGARRTTKGRRTK